MMSRSLTFVFDILYSPHLPGCLVLVSDHVPVSKLNNNYQLCLIYFNVISLYIYILSVLFCPLSVIDFHNVFISSLFT